MAKTRRLPSEIEEKFAACERIVDQDVIDMDSSIDSLSGIPDEEFEDEPSLVRHVEDLRSTTQRTRTATASIPSVVRSSPK